MKVTLLQTDIRWADPQANVRQAEEMIARQPGSDLYVLPEMWATGFATTPHEIAEDEEHSLALAWMRQTAARRSCAVSGSLAIRIADGTYRNRHYFVTPDALTCYDKHHLFTYGHEDRYYSAGDKPVVATFRGRRFLLLTCYDLRFPLWARYGRAGLYDAIIVVANWPESRQQAWRVLTLARAVENQCYLLACNRVGDDVFCHYSGESLVCGTKGETLVGGNRHDDCTLTADLDFEALDSIRQRFRVLDDRD
jgi:predicted amidohydrolase